MVVLVMLVFVLCWLPLQALSLYSMFAIDTAQRAAPVRYIYTCPEYTSRVNGQYERIDPRNRVDQDIFSITIYFQKLYYKRQNRYGILAEASGSNALPVITRWLADFRFFIVPSATDSPPLPAAVVVRERPLPGVLPGLQQLAVEPDPVRRLQRQLPPGLRTALPMPATLLPQRLQPITR